MRYYYLDSNKSIHGPHTKDELIQLLASGVISNSTLTAISSDTNWNTLEKILSSSQVKSKCSTWNTCPHCGTSLDVECCIPEKCSTCNKWIHGSSRSLWGTFIYAFKNYANFKGRATRKEFWGFYLFSFLFSVLFEQICAYFMQNQVNSISNTTQNGGEMSDLSSIFAATYSDPGVLLSGSLNLIFSLIIILPFLAVSVRRLHDTGSSAIAVVLACVSHVTFFASLIWWSMAAVIAFDSVDFTDLPSSQVPLSLILPFSFCFFSCIACLITSIYLVFKMLQPSMACCNKYGPYLLRGK